MGQCKNVSEPVFGANTRGTMTAERDSDESSQSESLPESVQETHDIKWSENQKQMRMIQLQLDLEETQKAVQVTKFEFLMTQGQVLARQGVLMERLAALEEKDVWYGVDAPPIPYGICDLEEELITANGRRTQCETDGVVQEP